MQNETIVDRVVARLKAQPLGDLITEEDLHDIVKQAIPKVFFEERIVTDGRYDTKKLPPVIVEVMRDLLKASATQAMTEWLKDNPQLVADYWKEVCDQGLLKYVQQIQEELATSSLRKVLRAWVDQINQDRMRMSLPMIAVGF